MLGLQGGAGQLSPSCRPAVVGWSAHDSRCCQPDRLLEEDRAIRSAVVACPRWYGDSCLGASNCGLVMKNHDGYQHLKFYLKPNYSYAIGQDYTATSHAHGESWRVRGGIGGSGDTVWLAGKSMNSGGADMRRCGGADMRRCGGAAMWRRCGGDMAAMWR